MCFLSGLSGEQGTRRKIPGRVSIFLHFHRLALGPVLLGNVTQFWCKGKTPPPRNPKTQIMILILSLTGFVFLGELWLLSEPQLAHL